MPPKKDDKKGKNSGLVVAAREVDPAVYIRKVTPIPVKDTSKELSLTRPCGKITRLEYIFDDWSSSLIEKENWQEPIAQDKAVPVRYPTHLQVANTTNITSYFQLDYVDPDSVNTDPKAKKKEEKKKPPAKGKVEEVVELTEQLANEAGRPLPFIYKGDDWQQYPELKGFVHEQQANNGEDGGDASQSPPLVDPLLCEAFRLISIFAPKISQYHNTDEATAAASEPVQDMEQNYLWRAVYPRARDSGKPVYNPSGKYCVRLFLGQRWRRVYVDDTLPLRADGALAVASCAERDELWPALVAKAIYTAYCASGFSFLDDADDALTAAGNDSDAEFVEKQRQARETLRTKHACEFLSFAIHALTGWQPHRFMQRSSLFANLKTQSAKILKSLAEVGVPFLRYDDIVRGSDLFHFEGDSSADTASGSELITGQGEGEGEEQGQGDGNDVVLKTKKRFKAEYLERKRIRDEIIDFVLNRERKVERVARALEHSPREVFCLVQYCEETRCYSVMPILGMAVPGDAPPDHENLESVQLLCGWKRLPLRRVVPNVSDAVILGKGAVPVKEFLEPFPMASPVEYKWCSVAELIEKRAFVLPFFTKTDCAHAAQWDRRWAALAPYPAPEAPLLSEKEKKEKEKKDKEKEKSKDKDKDKHGAGEKSPHDEVLAYLGTPSLTLLTLDVSQLVQQARERAAAASAQQQQDDEEVNILAEEEQRERERETEIQTETDAELQGMERELAEALDGQLAALSLIEEERSLSLNDSLDPLRESSRVLDVVDEPVLQDAEIDDAEPVPPAVPAEPAHFRAARDAFAVSLLVALQNDLVRDLQHTSVTQGTAALNSDENNAVSAAETTNNNNNSEEKKKNNKQASETVLVLEELRFDDAPPLVFVAKMSAHDDLPMVCKSFSIPSARLLSMREKERESESFVFALRLYSQASVSVSFHASVALSVGPAETEWPRLGFSVFTEHGEAEVTVDETEQLLFRLPLLTVSQDAAETENDRETTRETAGETERETVSPAELRSRPATANASLSLARPLSSSQQQLSQSIRHSALTFFHVTDLDIERSLQLMLVSVENSHPTLLTELPSIADQLVRLSPTPSAAAPPALYDSLIGFVQQPPRGTQIPRFAWKIHLLSRVPLAPPLKSIREQAVRQTFTGKYVANRSQTLFRDVYTVERASFPLAVKLNITLLEEVVSQLSAALRKITAEEKSEEQPHVELATKDVQVLLRFYRKHDMHLVSEYSGSESLHVFHCDLAHFLPPANTQAAEQPVAASTKPADKKPAPAGKGGKDKEKDAAAVASEEHIDFVLECVLDSEAMREKLPPFFFSRYPHVFDELFVSSSLAETVPGAQVQRDVVAQQASLLLEKPPEIPLLLWEVEMLSGHVVNVQHDYSKLQRDYLTKKQWEEKESGRAERALYAANFARERGILTQFSTHSTSQDTHNKSEHTRHPSPEHKGDEHAVEQQRPVVSVKTEVLSSAMVENLSLALSAEHEEVNTRFSRLLSLPKFPAKLEVVPSDPAQSMLYPNNPTHKFGSPEWVQAVQQSREEERQIIESQFQSLVSRSATLNDKLRADSLERLKYLSSKMRAQRNGMSGLLDERERLRVDFEKKNASLATLLKRGKDAKAAALKAEEAAEAERLKQEAKNAKGKKK